MAAEDLVEVLKHIPKTSHSWVSDEIGSLDDAAVVRPEGAKSSLVLTLDVITPIVDDPASFGRIAAANAISDVYAMGGQPRVALSFGGFPDALDLSTIGTILSGMAEKAKQAGCAIVGGHTVRDAEPKCGLAVVGSVEPGFAWTHKGAKPGQALVLTKPLGTGVIAQALRADDAKPEWIELATRSMEALNDRARNAGRAFGTTAATDVTGFGLLAHLQHILAASGVSARLEAERVPLLDGALAAIEKGHVPGGSKRNLRYVEPHLRGPRPAEPLLIALADAQTSGGLLLCVPADRAPELVKALEGDLPVAIIGEIGDGEPGTLTLE